MSLTLHIVAGGQTYSYAAELLDDDYTIEEQERDGVITMADVQISIDSVSFLGAETQFALPTTGDGWRARLLSKHPDTGAVTQWMNGLVMRSDVRHIPLREIWRVNLIDRAARVFLDDLVDATTYAGDSEQVTTEVLTDKPKTRSTSTLTTDIVEEARTWYDLFSMWEATLANLPTIDITYPSTGRSTGFWFDVRYLDGEGSEQVISRAVSLFVCAPGETSDKPDWTGRELYDILATMLAWRLRVRYAPFPSRHLLVEIVTDRWTPTISPSTSLTGKETDAYEVTFEAADLPEFAIQYENKVGELALLRDVVAPEDLAIYAALRYRVDPDGRGEQSDLVRVPLFLAHAKNEETGEAVVPDAEHPGYSEVIVTATPVIKEGNVWLVSLQGSSMIVRHEVQSPASGELTRTGAHFAANLFGNYGMRRAPYYALGGTFNIRAILSQLPAVGDPLQGVTMLSVPWMVKSQRLDILNFTAEMLLVYPVEVPTASVATPAVGPPTNLQGSCSTTGFPPPTPPYVVTLTWDEPAAESGESDPDYYEVQVFSDDPELDPGEAWVDPLGNFSSSRVYTHQVQAGSYIYRVRSVNGFGVSTWVYVTVSCP